MSKILNMDTSWERKKSLVMNKNFTSKGNLSQRVYSSLMRTELRGSIINIVYQDGGETVYIIVGYKEGIITATCRGESSLILSATKESKPLMNQLIPGLNRVMGRKMPIMEYELQPWYMKKSFNPAAKNTTQPTIEWETKIPDFRIKHVVNGKAHSPLFSLHNIRLFDGRRLNSYVENKDTEIEKADCAAVYGLDPGVLENTYLHRTMNGLDIYLELMHFERLIADKRQELQEGKITEAIFNAQVMQLMLAQQSLAFRTTDLGVEIPEPRVGEQVELTSSYVAFFNFHDDYVKNIMPPEALRDYIRKREAGEDISEYLPEGDWREYLEHPMVPELVIPKRSTQPKIN